MYKAINAVLSYIKKYPILILILVVGWLVNLNFFFPIKGNIGHDSIYVYFIVIPLLYVISLSFLVIYFGIRQNKSIFYIGPLTFFVFLATPFSYLLSWYKRGTPFFGFNYPTAMQSPSALTNLSYALTVLVLFMILIILEEKKRKPIHSLLLGFFVGLGFGLKFYGGIILGCIVGIHELLFFLQKKNLKNFIVLVGSGVLFLALSVLLFYDPFRSVKSGAIFALVPFAIPNTLVEDPDALYIPQLVMSRYFLLSLHKFSLRLIIIEFITTAIYLVYNFGTRIIGLFYLVKQCIQKKLNIFDWTLIITICFSVALTVALIQRGGDWWNTVQFFGYGLLLLNFFAAAAIYNLSRFNKKLSIIIFILIIVLTMPLNVELLIRAGERIEKRYDISLDEQKALAFLKTRQDNGTILSVPLFSNLSYIPARSGKPVFFADENVISNLGIRYEERKKLLSNLKDLNLSRLSVKYFYLVKSDKDYPVMIDKVRNTPELKNIYDNPDVIIYAR
ncbi:hypothetical protein HY041_01275 [Candidatus Roizmanbacteria bacterium]|nr:hypothetical protein [Candidatus Roizmanbacteria bacterium]